jgi:hypothetical protein
MAKSISWFKVSVTERLPSTFGVHRSRKYLENGENNYLNKQNLVIKMA